MLCKVVLIISKHCLLVKVKEVNPPFAVVVIRCVVLYYIKYSKQIAGIQQLYLSPFHPYVLDI